jgi:HNH endonuclease
MSGLTHEEIEQILEERKQRQRLEEQRDMLPKRVKRIKGTKKVKRTTIKELFFELIAVVPNHRPWMSSGIDDRKRRRIRGRWIWIGSGGRGPGSCWKWLGVTDEKGYGRVFWRGAWWGAHQLSLYLTTGVRTGGNQDKRLVACHKCDNPWCVNPSHLFLGTDVDNRHDLLKWSASLTPEAIADIRAAKTKIPVKILQRRYRLTEDQVRYIQSQGP